MPYTPWKKSRTYGDNYGGALRRRDADDIRLRLHSFSAPNEYETLPIYRVDNPSRDWFHPIGVEQIQRALEVLPDDTKGDTTHIWLRRQTNDKNDASFEAIWGSGVSLVTLYSVRKDMKRLHGAKKPSAICRRTNSKFGARILCRSGLWYSIWNEIGLNKFYLEYALLEALSYHSAYVWRDGRPNSSRAREQRQADWVRRHRPMFEELADYLLN